MKYFKKKFLMFSKFFILFLSIYINIFSENFYISTFNVLRLGHSNNKNFEKTATTIKEMKLIGLVEVMNKEGVEELVDALEKVTKKDWSYHISPYPVGHSSYKEFFAYVWEEDSVEFIQEEGFYPDTHSRFSRPPYGATFKIENFDFTLILVHSIYGKNKSQREAEAFYMKDVYEYFQNLSTSENDILIGGDFNLSGDSYSFKELMNYSNHQITYSVDPTLKTTIGKDKMANSYDNLFLSLLYTKEFTGVSGVIDYIQGDYAGSRKEISDHLPIFIEVNGSTDDD